MKTCIYTKTEFANADGEHILQNFLGARWVSSDISCNKVQSLFGKTIDSALEQGLRQFRNLLGTKGGRGGEGPDLKNVEDSKGDKYHLLPGGVPVLAQPVIATNQLEDGTHVVHAKLGDMEQLGWAIAKLRNQFPNASWNIEEIRGQLTSEQEYLSERIQLRAGIGGRDYFRGLLKAAFNLLGVNASDIALRPCFDGVREFILNGVGDDGSHIRWLGTSDKLEISDLGPFDHFIGIYSQGKTVDGVVQFFGGISHIVRLTDCYDGPEFCYGYQVNPLRDSDPAETRAPDFNPSKFPRFDEGHEKPGPDVWPIYSAVFSRLLESHYDLASKKEISRIVDEVLLPHDGKVLTEEIVNELVQKMSKFIVTRIQRNYDRSGR